MALVDDHLAVALNEIVDPTPAREALKHCDVDPTCGRAFGSLNATDAPGVDAKEGRELREPLIEQLLAMDYY
jgi:hypothetical protein